MDRSAKQGHGEMEKWDEQIFVVEMVVRNYFKYLNSDCNLERKIEWMILLLYFYRFNDLLWWKCLP